MDSLLLDFLCCFGLWIVHESFKVNRQPVVELSAKELRNEEAVAAKLTVPLPVAKEIVREIHSVTQKAPVASYAVPAATPQQAAKKVKRQIKTNTTPVRLPPAEKTIVIAQEQKVDVYRINLNKEHKVMAGVSYVDHRAYWNLGYRQKRVEVIAHMRGMNMKGMTGMYTVVEW
jgi:hypothetical protein